MAAFACWPFVLAGRHPTSRLAGFHAVIASMLLIAGLLGALWSLPVGPVIVSLGNIAYAGVITVTVALFAATRDVRVVRDAVRLVIVVNVLILLVLVTTSAVLTSDLALTATAVDPALFGVSFTSALVGGLLHIVQLIGIAVAMEQARARLVGHTRTVVATLGAFVVALTLDGMLFPPMVTLLQPQLEPVLGLGVSAVGAKLLLAGLYAVPLAVFLARSRHRAPDASRPVDLRGLVFGPRRELLAEAERAAADVQHLSSRLEAVLTSITDAIVQLDTQWRFTYLNEPARRALPEPEAEVLGRRFWDVFPQLEGSPVQAAFRRAVATGEPGLVRADGVVPGSVTEARIFPSADGVTLYIRDVSRRVAAEDRLRRTIAAEQQAAARLREVDRIKTAFLTAVSHELRTPLTVVHGLAHTLQRVRDDRLSPAQRIAIEDRLAANTQRLTRLLDDLLDIDRLVQGAGAVERDRVELVGLMQTLVRGWHHPERVVLDLPDTLEAHVDAVRVERIVTNLLDNAAKYAPDGPITLTLGASEDRVRITIADEGPGIPPDQRERVFEPFHRVHHDHPQPGTGIGLALVREFARLHGGDAFVQARQRGACVVVELAEVTAPTGHDPAAVTPGAEVPAARSEVDTAP